MEKKTNTILQIYPGVAGLDVLYCHVMDWQPIATPITAPAGPQAVGQQVIVGCTSYFHCVNIFEEFDSPEGFNKKEGRALGQMNFFGTVATREVAPPSWWNNHKHDRPGFGKQEPPKSSLIL